MIFGIVRHKNMPNMKHLEFHTQVKHCIETYGLKEKIGKELLDKYYADIATEENITGKTTASEHTGAIKKADEMHDNVIIGLTDTIKALVRFPDEDVVRTARRLVIVRKKWGYMSTLSFSKAVAAGRNWHSELTGKYAADVEKLGLEKWVAKLGESNKRLSNLISMRFIEAAAKVTVPMADVRKKVDADYLEVIKRTEAYIVINGIEQFEKFVNLMNTVIVQYGGKMRVRG